MGSNRDGQKEEEGDNEDDDEDGDDDSDDDTYDPKADGAEPSGATSGDDDGDSSSTSVCDGQPFYPGTGGVERCGEGAGAGYNVNIPWPCSNFGDLEYLHVINEIVLPLAVAFKPELVVVSAGFDCALGDKLGKQRVTQSGFAAMTRALGGV